MGKYGPGASMKTMLKAEADGIKRILDKSDLNKWEKQVIMDAYKEVAYQWCKTNAVACAVEKLCSPEPPKFASLEWNNEISDKMHDTFPDWYDDIEDIPVTDEDLDLYEAAQVLFNGEEDEDGEEK